MAENQLILPPGFQFVPSDEELVLHFLYHKAAGLPCCPNIIPDLCSCSCSCNPWDLDGKAFLSQNQWYFFSQITENRVRERGYWKQVSDDDEPIFTSSIKVGFKKYFVFCVGEAPAGIQTNWIMEEYHLVNCASFRKSCKELNKWALCRVHEVGGDSRSCFIDNNDSEVELSYLDEIFLSMDDDGDDDGDEICSSKFNSGN